jgi:hypothetical protein
VIRADDCFEIAVKAITRKLTISIKGILTTEGAYQAGQIPQEMPKKIQAVGIYKIIEYCRKLRKWLSGIRIEKFSG